MQLITVELTNTMTGHVFTFHVQITNWTQFYSRLSVLMLQLSIIENVSSANITHTIINNEALAA